MATVREYTKFVWIRTQFTAFHRWKDAPDDVKFLRDWHRHVFHVKIAVEVGHNDREVEFFQFKKKVEQYCRIRLENQCFEKSCEMIAEELLNEFSAAFCEVSEDGENGAFLLTTYKYVSDVN